jgi:hypothetical protein
MSVGRRELKRRGILACMFLIAVSALPAEPVLLFGGSFGYASQDTVAMQPWSATSLGVFLQSYLDFTPAFGLYSAATIGFIIASQDNGVALDPGQYQTFSLNALLGIGTRIALGRLTGIAGAGIYFGSSSLSAIDYNTFSSYYAGGAGAGFGVSIAYSLSYNWGIGANVNAAYYFTLPSNSPPTMAPSGFSVFGGVGVTYFYHSTANFEPGVSRF